MSFNLKKKKAQVSNINDQASFDSYIQMLITQLNETGTLPPDDALSRLSEMNSLFQYGTDSFEKLINMIRQKQDITEQQQNMQNNMVAPQQQPGSPVLLSPTTLAKGKNKMIKPFNLKKAQFENPMGGPVPMQGFSDTLNDAPELQGDPLEMQQDIGTRKFRDGADVSQWLQNEVDMEGALQFTTQNDVSENADLVKEMIEQYYDMMGDSATEPRDMEIVAGQIFDYFPEGVKEGNEIQVQQKQFNTINEIIKKTAQNIINKNKKKPFNIKTAQHKSLDNAILWGPGQSRIDPFLHQPVSDWHIVERNKGFGLVVDDVWNIDYETIWRENIMDKYSRPYRNKEGEYVGGYIQKRFEVDKNIPDTNNYQLKPGEKRRPILPEYGNTESRLQAARAKGDIAGSNDTSKPFNWKEAKSKKMEKQATGMGLDEGLVDYYVRTVKQNAQKYPQMDFDTLMEFSSVPQGLYAKVSRLVQGGMEQNPQPQGHGTNSFSRGENSLIDMGSPVQASSKKKS